MSNDQLPLWRTTLELAELVYRATRACPELVRHGLATPLRQAALTVVERAWTAHSDSTAVFLRDLGHVRTALRGLEARLLVADRLAPDALTGREDIARCLQVLQRLLDAYVGSLRAP